MGSLRQLQTSLDFKIEPFLDHYLMMRDFRLDKREEFKGWIRLTYQDPSGTRLKIDLLWKVFSISLDFGDNPYFNYIPYNFKTGPCDSKKEIIQALSALLSIIKT